METGYFTADERNTHGHLRPDVVTKNDWVLNAYSQFPIDVFNLSSHDLRYVADLLSKSASVRSRETAPLLSRLVSANTVAVSTGLPIVKPFIVREVPSRQNGAKPIRVAFIGLTETEPDPPRGLKFIDFVEAARHSVSEARKVSDLVIVLAKIKSQNEITRIARETPGIDVIINGNAGSLEDSFTPPVYVGPTIIVFTPFETRMLGELRVYRSAQGKFSTKQRFVALDEMLVPEDPTAKRIVEAAAKAESETRITSSKSLESWLASARTRGGTAEPHGSGSSPAFVTSAACSKCHVDQYLKWSNSAHAHATDPLVSRPLEFDSSCLDCHATQTQIARGSNMLEGVRLPNVQCEQCHGPGSDHVAKPAKGYGRITNMQSFCVSCHTVDISPEFKLQTAWEKIKH